LAAATSQNPINKLTDELPRREGVVVADMRLWSSSEPNDRILVHASNVKHFSRIDGIKMDEMLHRIEIGNS